VILRAEVQRLPSAHFRLCSLIRRAYPMSMPASEPWTVEEVRALPSDGNRYEVVDGELLVTPAPTLDHQDAVGSLFVRLREYTLREGVGYAAVSPADITLGPRTLVQPDLFVAALVGGRRPREWSDVERLLLAVEVLSPSTARADRAVKRALYQRQGVGEYWIVDLDARLVERWRPEDQRPEILTDVLDWSPEPGREPLRIELAGFFEQVAPRG
jgi:Uma2 family endonuclease